MDWIGDKLSQLIQEGQKALGREVVVASEAPEDEMDDDAGAWEEEQQDPYRAGSSSNRSTSRLGSRRQQRSHHIPVHPSHISPHHSRSGSASLSSSPRLNQFDALALPPASYSQSIPMPMGDSLRRGPSVESDNFPHSASTSFREDESTWQSPELRESMSKARARYLANRR
jgi:hypothetical protein